MYDAYGPVVGAQCFGTAHQAISGIERVVFLGDSVTVGTLPAGSGDYYRNLLADDLAAAFGLDAPGAVWRSGLTGSAGQVNSGDFWSCAKSGAHSKDLLIEDNQIGTCFPPAVRDQTTLVVMTMGGNNIASMAAAGTDGVPVDTLYQYIDQFSGQVRDAVEWMLDPNNVPGTTYIVMGNLWEFTDGTGDIASCPAASLGGLSPWDDPDELAGLMYAANEAYMDIATSTGIDLVFMLEQFCGHGYKNDDPAAPCYRGANTPRWFDYSCIHPNVEGHAMLRDMFGAVIGLP